jgi:hypothetical protein
MRIESKVAIAGAVIAVTMLLTSGCNTGMVSSSVETTTATIAFDGTPKTVTQKNDVLAMRGTFLVNTEVDKTNIKWGDVTIGVGGYSTAGDVESINAIGNAISNGILAYFTYGTAPAVKGAVMASLVPSQPSACTNAPAAK